MIHLQLTPPPPPTPKIILFMFSEFRNGWLIRTASKSFAVYAATSTEKQEWMAHINKCIEDLLRKSKYYFTVAYNQDKLDGLLSESELHYNWRLVSQYVLVSSPIWDFWPEIFFCCYVGMSLTSAPTLQCFFSFSDVCYLFNCSLFNIAVMNSFHVVLYVWMIVNDELEGMCRLNCHDLA
jgi:hypothetical protein